MSNLNQAVELRKKIEDIYKTSLEEERKARLSLTSINFDDFLLTRCSKIEKKQWKKWLNNSGKFDNDLSKLVRFLLNEKTKEKIQ